MAVLLPNEMRISCGPSCRRPAPDRPVGCMRGLGGSPRWRQLRQNCWKLSQAANLRVRPRRWDYSLAENLDRPETEPLTSEQLSLRAVAQNHGLQHRRLCSLRI